MSCKLSPKETICMKCQIPFSEKEEENISKCHLLKLLPNMLSVKLETICFIIIPWEILAAIAIHEMKKIDQVS